MSLSQRALSSQSCSTSAPCQPAPRPQRGARCSSSSPEGPKAEPRQQRSLLRAGWAGTGCHLKSPHPHQVSSKGNGSGPAVMQGLGSSLPTGKPADLGEASGEAYDVTEFVAETLLPTRTGQYRLRGYRHTFDGGRTYTEPCCIMTGRPENGEQVPVRVHDACFTSEVLGSLKCDCAGQLAMAMRYIRDSGPGLIIYLQQEGRGIGLANKIAAYALQEEGLDTVDANRALGLPDDCREYSSVRNILADLGIRSIRLMTNNPRKIRVLEELGVVVTARIPCIVKAQEFSMGYLATKQARMAHWIDETVEGEATLDGSFCYWNHDGEPLKPSRAPLKPSSGAKRALAAQHQQQQQQQQPNGKLISRASS